MKLMALIAVLVLSLPALSHAEDTSDEVTEGGSAALRACLGNCEENVNQTPLPEATKGIKESLDMLLDPGIVKTPNSNSSAVPEAQDI
jgi:hypothetical protein